MEYDTRQKKELLALLKTASGGLSAADIAARLPSVGLSSVYRLLAKAQEEGLVVSSMKGRVRLWSYVGSCSHHMHGCCTSCGALVHLEEDVSRRIASALDEEGLELDQESPIGILCPECRKRRRV